MSDWHATTRRIGLACAAAASLAASPQTSAIDICGCEGHVDSLGDYVNSDESTHPPGTRRAGERHYIIPVPEDGLLIFDSFRINDTSATFDGVTFERNEANTPVTILVAGDMLIEDGANVSGVIRTWLGVSAGAATAASATQAGTGGAPGPGGYRGGDGGSLPVRGLTRGGDGLGAGGGAGAAGAPATGEAGTYIGSDTLLPLVGGAGGGGGAGTGSDCSAGAGGGGGGSILIAVNGTLTIDGGLYAFGGPGSNASGSPCGAGGAGSGGAIRIVASEVNGSGRIRAQGGDGLPVSDGRIRIEAIVDTFSDVVPIALRSRTIGPVDVPGQARVDIVEIDGAMVPDPPTGSVGGIDVVVPTPGDVSIDVVTHGVPGGTTVEVVVKPDVGASPARQAVTLEADECDVETGDCFARAWFNLPAGAYYVEAQATFSPP